VPARNTADGIRAVKGANHLAGWCRAIPGRQVWRRSNRSVLGHATARVMLQPTGTGWACLLALRTIPVLDSRGR
jgi:hypothetical protein